MRQFPIMPAAIALSVILVAPTTTIHAQTAPAAPPSEQDHNAHHPDEKSESAAQVMPSQRGGMTGMMGQQPDQSGGAMMGGNMGQMMPMMRGGGRMMGGMPFEHVEGHLAFLKTELKITDAQMPQWNRLADAVRSIAQSMKGMRQQMMQGGQGTQAGQSASARLDRQEQMLSARLEAVRSVKAAFDPLYTALSDEQKKTADELFSQMGAM